MMWERYSVFLLFLASFIVTAIFALFDGLVAAKFPPTFDQMLFLTVILAFFCDGKKPLILPSTGMARLFTLSLETVSVAASRVN